MKKYILLLIVGLICGWCLHGQLTGTSINPIEVLTNNALKDFLKSDITINETILREKLSTCAELSTFKYEYTGQVEYTHQNELLKALGTQHGLKSFTVEYDATMFFSVDLEKADIKVDSLTNVVEIKLPCAKLQTVSIPPSALKTKTNRSSLINIETQQDLINVLQFAEENAKTSPKLPEFIKKANTQAVKTLALLLAPMTETTTGVKPYQVNITIDGEMESESGVEVPVAK